MTRVVPIGSSPSDSNRGQSVVLNSELSASPPAETAAAADQGAERAEALCPSPSDYVLDHASTGAGWPSRLNEALSA